MPTYEAEATLAQLEAEFHRLADNWRAEFLKTRALKIQFRGLPAAIAEMGRDAGAEPEVAKVFFKAAERLGQACHDVDAEMAIALSPIRIALDNGSGQEVAAATHATWRKRIAEPWRWPNDRRTNCLAPFRGRLRGAQLRLATVHNARPIRAGHPAPDFQRAAQA